MNDNLGKFLIIAGLAWYLYSRGYFGGTGGAAVTSLPPASAPFSSAPSSPSSSGGVMNYGDVGTLARTIYGEARNQSQAAMQGVASVVLNRLNQGFAGGSIAGICTARDQFDCWNVGDPNRAVITDPNVVNDPIFQTCAQIANDAVAGNLPDNTFGAVFYYSPPLTAPPVRAWGPVTFTVQIDELSFFKSAQVA